MPPKVELSEGTLERLRALAEERRLPIDVVLEDMIESFVAAEAADDPVLGMLAREPELMDTVVAEAMDGHLEVRVRADERATAEGTTAAGKPAD